MSADPLAIATAAKRPIPTASEPLEVERLVSVDSRRPDDDAELEEFLTELRDVERKHRP